MAETTADVKRDIALTRERMSSTLAELEHKLNVTQIVRDNPWPALAIAVGAGLVLSGSGADVKAAAATVGAGATRPFGPDNSSGTNNTIRTTRMIAPVSRSFTRTSKMGTNPPLYN